MRALLDTRQSFDAGLCGYDGPVDPVEDGEGLIIRGEAAGLNRLPEAMLQGPDGEVVLRGRSEIEQTIAALQKVLGLQAEAPTHSLAEAA